MWLDLPPSLFLMLLKEYMGDDASDYQAVDVAMSSRVLRDYYLSIYSGITMPCFEKEYTHTSSSLEWMIVRNIKLNDIIVSSLSHKNLYVIDRLPFSLRSITFDKCNFFNDKCYLNDNQIETIVIRNSMISNNALKGLTKSCRRINCITLDFESCEEHEQFISDTAIYELAKNCCSSLRRIHTRYALHISEGCLQHIRKSHRIETYNG